jgi:hypothetical protein
MKYVTGVIFLAIIIIQSKSMIKTKSYGELAAFGVIIALAILYTYGYILNVEIPAFSYPANLVFRPLAKLIFPDYTE